MSNDLKGHNGWNITSFGQMAKLVKESWKPGDEKTSYLGLEHINVGTLSINSIGESSQLNSNKFRFKSGDILFGKLRPYFRKVVIPKFDGVCSTDIWVIRSHKNFDQRYLYYFVANSSFIDKSMGANTGAHMPRADWKFLEQTEWLVPKIHEQKAIAAVLFSFDNKIELLRRQNKTLEDMAQTIFKEWFVDYRFPGAGKMIDSELGLIPEGWRVFELSELVKIINGYSYKGTELVKESNAALVTLKSFDRNGGFQTRGFKPFCGNPKKNQEVQIGDLVVAHTDLTQDAEVLGNPAFIFNKSGFEKMYFTMDLVKVISQNKNVSNAFLYYLMRTNNFKRHCVGYSNGTTVLHMSKKAIPEYKIALPNDLNLVYKFSKVSRSITKKISNNLQHINTLSQFRDGLLPKLMSGKISVKYF